MMGGLKFAVVGAFIPQKLPNPTKNLQPDREGNGFQGTKINTEKIESILGHGTVLTI